MRMMQIVTLSLVGSLAAIPTWAQDVVFSSAQWVGDAGSAGLRVPIEAKTIKGAPYSAEVVSESIQTLADGNRLVHRSTTRVYRDAEGRIRREEDRPSGGAAVSITDPIAGVAFSLDGENHIAFQAPNVAALRFSENIQKLQTVHEFTMLTRRVAPGSGQTGEVQVTGDGHIAGPTMAIASFEARLEGQLKVETLPARDFEGLRAEGVRRTTTIPAGEIGNDWPIEIVSEEWFSPELQILVLTERRDPRLGTSTYRVVNISRVEPAAYLFEVPADYTVKPMGPFRPLEPLQSK